MPTDTPPPTLGGLLRDHMAAAGLTQAAVARLSGLSQPTVSRILSGVHDPALGVVLKLLGGLGLSLRWLHERGVRPA